MLEALPCARIAPVHRRIAKIGDNRHVGVEADAELREERRTRDSASIRQRRPRHRKKDEIPRDRPAEPPAHRMREPVHRAMRQQDERCNVQPRSRDRKAQSLLREPAEDDEEDHEEPEHRRRLAPWKHLPRVAAVTRNWHTDRRDDRNDCAERRRPDQPDRTRIGEPLVVPERRRHRRNDRTRDKCRDERVARRLNERCNRRGDPAPGRLRDEHERREQHQRRARAAAIENRLLCPLLVAALLEENRRNNGADEDDERENEDCRGR